LQLLRGHVTASDVGRLRRQRAFSCDLDGGVQDRAMNARRAGSDAFELDGTFTPATVLRLKTADVEHIEAELRAHIAATPQRFLYAPVVVDVAGLDGDVAELPLHDLAERLRAVKLVPVGAANLPSWAIWNAAAAGMANVELAPPHAPVAEPHAPVAEPHAPVAEPHAPVAELHAAAEPAVSTVTVRQPVRAGQVIYAEHADLVVLAAVNPGAQVVADGHIHVYGPLRGRAIAGARGMSDARVFCQSLEAELISIAGRHLLADEIAADRRRSGSSRTASASRASEPRARRPLRADELECPPWLLFGRANHREHGTVRLPVVVFRHVGPSPTVTGELAGKPFEERVDALPRGGFARSIEHDLAQPAAGREVDDAMLVVALELLLDGIVDGAHRRAVFGARHPRSGRVAEAPRDADAPAIACAIRQLERGGA
jgi:septum site-determining protein MinC